MTKVFKCATVNPDKPTVLLMAPTGVTAINIDGMTTNTALEIPKETTDNVPAMSNQNRTHKVSMSKLKLLIIDEISVIANTTLLHIHQTLKEIFGTSNK